MQLLLGGLLKESFLIMIFLSLLYMADTSTLQKAGNSHCYDRWDLLKGSVQHWGKFEWHNLMNAKRSS